MTPERGDLVRIREDGKDTFFRVVDVRTEPETFTVDGIELEAPPQYQPRSIELELVRES